jgi:hypothetical protein
MNLCADAGLNDLARIRQLPRYKAADVIGGIPADNIGGFIRNIYVMRARLFRTHGSAVGFPGSHPQPTTDN